MKKNILLLITLLLLVSCNQNSSFKVIKKIATKTNNNTTLFSLLPNSKTQINFQNTIKEDLYFNFINYPYIYNGAGVATADFNNDGLVDIYFTANQQSNKLYLNKGNFKFEDITKSANVIDEEGWSTGVSIIDVNNDGWLDIYICKSGSLNNNSLRENKLYINQKNNTFKESASKWKLNDAGFGTQSYFFDFDKDGDLDMYLVNHRPDFINTTKISKKTQSTISTYSTDKLFRNDGNTFTDITKKAGLLNKAWGLSASIGDFNNDNWPDVYVCNDFLEPDMLYINNKNGSFTNQIIDRMNHISLNSMGSDYADINNDLQPDLLVLEMASEDHIRSKSNMATMSVENFNAMVQMNYHHQYMVNTLQLNNGNGMFSDIGQISGIAKTDWSWAPLIADFDNDGLKDIFITNGILKELSNQDFRHNIQNKISKGIKMTLEEAIGLLPSNKLNNYTFKNNGNFSFTNTSNTWGINTKTQSNGIAYADFDNDGDLDLVINNVNDSAQIYQNNDTHNFIQLKLEGNAKNKLALGTKITITTNGEKQYQELYLSRGYLSSVQNIANFGIGNNKKIDEIKIEWPNQKVTILNNIEANQIISINSKNAVAQQKNDSQNKTLLTQINTEKKGISYKHQENTFNDFENQILLPHSQSHNGPFITKADVNSDGLEDFFVGGAAEQSGELYLQTTDGNFTKQKTNTWINDKKHEDLGVLFFDADNDNDQDLYIVSGGSEFTENSPLFQDRLYINNGKGNFTKSTNMLPKIYTSGQTVKASDIDNDGDLDLFIGGRIVPDKYPYPPKSYILINENGKFIDKTKIISPKLSTIGMVTDATFSDYDNDGDDDLIVVGEWMPITIFENINGKLVSKQNTLNNTSGIWFSIAANDIDNDGDIDFFVGNLGLNTKFKANSKKSFEIFCDDFDKNGTYDIVLTNKYKGKLVPARGKECSSQQMPFIKDKFPSYQSFAEASLVDIYGENNLTNALHYETKILESVFLENLGNGKFKLQKLPNSVQISPIMDFEFLDINNDNLKEVLIIGNHYSTEVETVRYDASYGAILAYKKGVFNLLNSKQTGFITKGNVKNIGLVSTKSEIFVFITNNNNKLHTFALNN